MKKLIVPNYSKIIFRAFIEMKIPKGFFESNSEGIYDNSIIAGMTHCLLKFGAFVDRPEKEILQQILEENILYRNSNENMSLEEEIYYNILILTIKILLNYY